MGTVSDKTRKISEAVVASLQKSGINDGDLSDLIALAQSAIIDDGDRGWGLQVTKFVKDCKDQFYSGVREACFEDEVYRDSLKTEAPLLFESFLYYMEIDRAPEKRFYAPRERTLKTVTNDLQKLADDEYLFYGLSMPPRVGKSTICIFFLAWEAGRNPDRHNAMGGHSGILAKGFYKEFLNLVAPKDKSEYTFYEIFPDVRLESKSADEFTVNLNKPDRFSTLTCRGVDGTWTGAIDVSAGGYLYVDDLIRDRTESLSPIRLENRYQDYLNVMVDRKNDGAKELMVMTRWAVIDPMGHVKSDNAENPKYLFREIPALNGEDESNFEYDYGVGFSTQYYLDLRKRLDPNEWWAKYMQKPYVREGLLFPEEEIKRYNGILPEGDLVQVVSACDVSWGGGDSLSMPIGYQYKDGSVFIVEWVFMNAAKEYTVPRVCAEIVKHNIQRINFEANVGGDMYAFYVDEKLKELGYKCSITSSRAPNTMNKLAKIQQYSQDIKSNFYFLDNDHANKEYKRALEEMMMFVQVGKNERDDSPDSLAQLEAFIEGGWHVKAQIMNSPF